MEKAPRPGSLFYLVAFYILLVDDGAPSSTWGEVDGQPLIGADVGGEMLVVGGVTVGIHAIAEDLCLARGPACQGLRSGRGLSSWS